MKFQKFLALCFAALCFGMLTTAASASSLKNGDVAAVAGYCQGDEFHAFVSVKDKWPENVMAKAQLDGKTQAFSMKEAPISLEEDDRPVSYLLLVDRSGSMKGKRGDKNPQNLVQYFAGALYDAASGSAKFAVATFDENFNNDATDFTNSKRTFLNAVRAIEYNEQTTNLAQSMVETLEYLEGYQRKTGELVNLILITDGIPSAENERITSAAAAGRVDVSPSILFHTFGIGTSDPESPASLDFLARLGQGAHTKALDSRRKDAETAAQETAELVNDLYSLRFSLGEEQREVTDAIIYFYDQTDGNGSSVFTKLTDVPVLGSTGEVINQAEAKPVENAALPKEGTSESIPEDDNEADTEEGSETDSNAEEESDSNVEGSSKADTEESSGDSGDSSAGGSSSSDEGGGDTGLNPFHIILIVLAVIAVLAALAGAYLVLRRKRSGPDSANSGMEIYMRLEVISGQFATKEQDFYLTDELIIGRGRNCDIVLKDPDLARRCARIYLSDQFIWIEDVGAADGVYLGGMRLYNANRLRSGDEISIGNTRFQFKF